MQNTVQQLQDEITSLKELIEQTAINQEEKDRLQEEYQRSQNRFRTIFEQSSLGKKIIDADLRITKVNQALLNILGYTQEEMLGKKITDLSIGKFKADWKKLQHTLWTTDMSSFSIDTCLIKKDNTSVWVHVTTILIEDEDKMLGYTIIEDVSERKELERLRNLVTQQQQRHHLAEMVLNAQEEERRRIAESLHHGLGQVLFGVKLSLNKIKFNGEHEQHGNEDALRYSMNLLNDSIIECRRISHDLIPTLLEDRGLKSAVEDICRQLSNTVKFYCTVKGLEERINPVIETAIYRMVQELMMNIIKHAQASFGRVSIKEHGDEIHVEVEDNGKGFETIDTEPVGIGLQTIRYKVNLLGGTFNISSTLGKGTQISIVIPQKAI
ncbi:PAS domain S-box-containing protein [Pedobacter psychrotolerans]|uniref:Oxygen sensor histidine kinase NreB n=1 Tax=Pedobacter psychrotolerans TaxID=1843235 RepID=A0A4R2HN65_9SPHI|nr:PAS domain-containing sensor histidine kinase [Pedobacter psychrotolerans]TCO31202.1 PAS domain S-box-containing protein [Pedobacter psychrotolerans]GGE41449.1 histidine kinase [Pedobacter psychrotolerans]